MNRATRINVAALGVVFALSGMTHGFFETLQGSVPTDGPFIFAIGAAQKMWPHGDEAAFTLIPSFLLTGLAAMTVGLAVLVWSLAFVQRRHGPTVLLLLFILLFLVGGGVAQVLFFPFLWLVSTRIHGPLAWWRRVLSGRAQERLAGLWPASLVLSTALLAVALVIATTGFVPGVRDPDAALAVMLACLGLEVIAFPLAFVSGFAHDIVSQPEAARAGSQPAASGQGAA